MKAARFARFGGPDVLEIVDLPDPQPGLGHDGVDLALDVAGSGVLPELVELTGGPANVVTVADFLGAREHGVTFSTGEAGRAFHVLDEIGALIETGRFSVPVVTTFPLDEIAAAHRASEDGHVHGKLVLVVDPADRSPA